MRAPAAWTHLERRPRCRWLSLALALAAPLTAWPAEPEARVALSFRLNHTPRGEIFPILREEDVLLGEEELKKASVKVEALSGRRETIDGEVYLSLRSLAPEVSYELDEENAQMNLTVPSTLLPLTRMDLRTTPRPVQLERARNPSAFVNYAAHLWNSQLTMVTEAAAGMDELLLSSTVSWVSGRHPVRGFSQLTIDKPEPMLRFVVGDSQAASGPLGGGAILGGFHVSRDFGLDPYFVRMPSFGLADSTETPSSVDVYVNGARVRSSELPPGPFELVNLPVTRGLSEARYVLRDVFGRERELSHRQYVASGLLPRDVAAFNLSLGLHREDVARQSFDYRAPAALGTYRRGLSTTLTGGLRLELAPALASGGMSLAFGLPRGELEIAAAGSFQPGQPGVAGSATYTYLAGGFALEAAVRGMSPAYANLSLEARADRPLLEAHVFTGLSFSERFRLSGELAGSRFRDANAALRASVVSTLQLGKATSMSLSGSGTSRGTGMHYDAMLSFSMMLDAHTSSFASFQQSRGRPSSVISVSRATPSQKGLGYRLHGNLGASPSAEGQVEYQGQYGRYATGLKWFQGKLSLQARAAGGLALVEERVMASRPIEHGFALVRAPGLRGARVFLNNSEVAKTDELGDALVTNLLPYYGNRLSISDQDIPDGFGVPDLERHVAPYARRGAVVRFSTRRIVPLRGTLVHGDAAATPFTVGDLFLRIGREELQSPIGTGGEFELEGVPPGSHEARVSSQGEECRVRFEVDFTEQKSIELGAVPCLPRPGSKP
jgi:outer membrane usher protein